MPRAANGTYSLPAGNPVVVDTDIESSWANTTLEDIADALTDSLSRSGEGGMTAPLEFDDGTSGAPGITWESETSTGFYRAGSNDMRVAVAGNDKARWTATAGTPMEVYDGTSWGAVHFGFSQGSFTPTFTGFSADPSTPVVYYVVYGKMVTVILDFGLGTSDDTVFQINNIPAAIQPDRTFEIILPKGVDNATAVDITSIRLQASSATWLFCKNGDNNGWTNSGFKGLDTSFAYSFTYCLDTAA